MANERIVSPGVFTREKDLSFLPQGVSEIGAAFIGPFDKGPAFVPSTIYSEAEAVRKFGNNTPDSYTSYAVRNYMRWSPSATLIRILGTSGYSLSHPVAVVATGSYGKRLVSMLHPTYVVSSDDSVSLFAKSTLTSNASGSAVIKISGSYTTDTSTFTNATDKNGLPYSMSIDYNSANFIGNIFGSNAKGLEPVYNYSLFKFSASSSLATDPTTTLLIETGSADAWDFTDEYSSASTPWITSQQMGGSTQNLFKFHTISHGTYTNTELKVSIEDIRPAGSIAGSEYGQFNITVRYVDQSKIPGSKYTYQDDDLRPAIVERFTCNLDPNSPNFIVNVIGDRYYTSDDEGRIKVWGDKSNKSIYIRVEVADSVKNGAVSSQLVPLGFRALKTPIPSGFTQPAATTYKSAQTLNGIFNKNIYYGFDYGFSTTDNLNYLAPLPVAELQTTGSNSDFSLENYTQHPDANYPTAATKYTGSINLTSQTSYDTRKFVIPFQGGFDGWKPNIQKKTGTHITAANSMGFDFSSTSAAGYTAYKKAIDMLSNQDEYDINMILTPGVIHRLHSAVTNYAKTMAEDRGDTFYIMDPAAIDDNIVTANDAVSTVDSSYVGSYFPWVKGVDNDNNKDIWLPPSVAVVQAYAYNDRTSAPWFAVAGFNRASLPQLIDTRMRLNTSDRDTLYEGRLNPIVYFTKEGIAVWGQKTLQARPSALDRINVRRLLITAKKFIASSAKYLVFEQNVVQTRQRFLNIVNPYLESIQQRNGLYAFKVKMDESNNTPETIDRLMLMGEIYLQPSKTAEFIVIDFNVLPTGATFPA
jgi:hypothetical protein